MARAIVAQARQQGLEMKSGQKFKSPAGSVPMLAAATAMALSDVNVIGNTLLLTRMKF